MKKIKSGLLYGLIIVAILLSGCGKENNYNGIEKDRDLEWTVVVEEKLPEELLETINEKKELPFRFTYQDGGYLYICVGYGEQASGGYSVTAEDLYLTDDAICLKTRLIGPGEDVPDDGIKTYPYIVIKTEYVDCSVAFDI